MNMFNSLGFDSQEQMFLLDGVNIAAGFAVNWLLQSTLLILVGLVVGALLRSRGSAVQSLVYRTTLVAVLICPLATVALASAGFSGWSVSMPESWAMDVTEPKVDSNFVPEVAPEVVQLDPVSEYPVESESTDTEDIDFSTTIVVSEPMQSFPLAASTDSAIQIEEPSVEPTIVPEVATPVPVVESIFTVKTFGVIASLAASLWCLVTFTLFLRLASAWWKLWRLKRNATKVEPELNLVCEQLSGRMNVSAPEIFRSPFLPSPCLAGLRNPSILLPEDDCRLSMQDVLIHELAHLRRHDCHWNLLRQVATSFFFFQPLLWILSRKLEITAEEVCDDFVVQFGGDRTEYANRLVGIAELSTAPIAAAGVGVVSLRSMLGQRVTRILDTSRTLSTRASKLLFVTVLGCGMLGTAMAGLLGVSSAVPEDVIVSLDSDDENKSQELGIVETSKAESQSIKYRGKVVDEDDRPIENATVEVNRWQPEPTVIPQAPLATTTSGPGGEFELIVDKSKFPDAGPRFWKQTAVVAHRQGYGIDWLIGENIKPNQPINLSLVSDDVPVKGRLVSLEGEPLSDVSVRVEMLWASDNQDLGPVLKAWSEGQIFWQATSEHLPNRIRQLPQVFQKNIKTDAEGYFSISGLGQERAILVILEGPTIAYTWATIVTRKMAPTVANVGVPDQQTVHGANCVITVAPSQAVTGIVKDAKTGEPMAGVGIESYVMAEQRMVAQRQIRVKTDEEGRYTLRGLPKGAGNQIIAVPNDDQPYLMRVFDVPNPTGMKPIDLDLELNRGVWITGQLTNKATGKNIRIEDEAYVYYYPYLSNPFAQATPEYDRQEFLGYQLRYKIATDGSYRLVGLPGKAIVGATIGYAPFPQGQGAEDIDGADEDGKFPTYRVGAGPGPKNPTIYREVDIAETAESFELNFQLESGKKIAIAMTDPAGRDLEGVKVQGHERFSGWKKIPDATFEAAGLKLGEKRTMLFHHPERNLGKAVRVTAGEDADQKLSVQLQPCVTIRGRLVGKDEEPVSGSRIRIEFSPSEDFAPSIKNVSTDADGHFEHSEVLPGTEYAVMAEGTSMGFAALARNLTVSAGETIDLGTINVSSKERPEPERMKGAKQSAPATTNSILNALPTYSGRVETPQGEPIAGAKIWLASSHGFNSEVNRENFKGLLRELGASDEQGRFAVSLDAKTIQQVGFSPTQLISPAQLVATAKGRGMDWMPLEVFEDNAASSKQRDRLQSRIDKAQGNGRFANRILTLRPESKPVRGRLIDLEGRPLPKVNVLVESLYQPDVAGLLNALKKSSKGEVNEVLSTSRFGVWGLARSELQKLIPPVTTNQNGEFELHGIGDDQLAILIFDADRIEARPLSVLGREMEMLSLPHIKNVSDGSKDVFAGRDFDYAVAPSIPVEGVVTDYDTGEPVANVLVHVDRLFKEEGVKNSQLRLDTHHMRAVTDQQGRFRITGMPPGEGHVIEAVPSKSAPFLMTSQDVSPSLTDGDAKRIEIKLKRGVWIEGRVTDKRSGEPLAVTVDYLALKKNPHSFESLGLDWVWGNGRFRTDRDGNYRTLGLPGPGVLLVKSGVPGYPLAVGVETIDGCNESGDFIPTTPFPLQGLSLREYQLLKQIDPAVDATTFSSDMALDAGLSVSGRVVGPDGKPVSDLRVFGQTEKDAYFRPQPSDNVSTTDRFIVNGYDGKGPRHLFFKNKDETLVGQYRVEGDTTKEIAVTLQKSVCVTGRLIDKQNDLPAARYFVACEQCSLGNEKTPPVNFVIHWCHTDDDGRFEIKGLMAGAKYRMNAFSNVKPGDIGFAIDLTDAKPGDVVEINDVTGPNSQGSIEISTKESPPVRRIAIQATEEKFEAKSTKADTISGVVVGADRKPVAGAEIYSIISRTREHDSLSPKLVATSDENGKYSFRLPKLDLPKDAPALWDYRSSLVIKAPGHGFVTDRPESLLRQIEEASSPQGWIARTLAGVSGAVIGLPPAGNPIKGRILDIDGQPVANAKIRIQWFTGYGSSGFSGRPLGKQTGKFVDNDAEQWKGTIDSLVQIIEPQRAIDAFPTATTDADGRFELKDIGANRLFTLVIQGEGIETKKVYAYNQPGKKVDAKSDYNGLGTDKYGVYSQEFTHIAGPSNPVIGKVVDYDSDKPISNALVIATSLHGNNMHLGDAQGLFTVKTDDEGNFRMEGLRVGASNKLVCFCNNSEAPYPLLGFRANTSAGPIDEKFRMKQGVWAEGGVFDSKTKKPWTGHINYCYFRNPELERTHPGVKLAMLQTAYWTNNEGRFRVPVWRTKGLLSYFCNTGTLGEAMNDAFSKYPRGMLGGEIEGYDTKEPRSLETFPFCVFPSNYWMNIEINPDGSEDSIIADMPLVASRSLMVKTTWPESANIKKYQIYNSNGHEFWNPVDSPEVEVKALKQGERREIFAFHREKNLIGKVTVGASMPDGTVAEIKDIQKAGFIVGQLVDEDGEPISNAIVDSRETPWAFHPGKMSSPSRIPTDENGNFRLTGIVPGNSYGASVSAPRKYKNQMMNMGIGYAFSGVILKPGETKDLGQLKPAAEKQEITESENEPANPLAVAAASKTSGSTTNGSTKLKAVENSAVELDAARTTIRATILLPDGSAAEETHVALTGFDNETSNQIVFGYGTTDEDGECALTCADFEGADEDMRLLVARKDGLAVGWTMLNQSKLADDKPVKISLKKQGIVKGRLVDIDGQPAAGEKLQVEMIMNPNAERGSMDTVAGFRMETDAAADDLPRAWIQPVTTDEDGRFKLTGVPEGFGVYVKLIGSKKFAPQGISLNTGQPEQRGPRDGTYRPLIKNVDPGEEAVLTLSPAKLITGKVAYEDTNEPVEGAKISIWASQQEMGSMTTVTGKTDADGNYRLRPEPGIRFGVSAYPPAGVAYMGRQAEKLVWENSDATRNVDIKLPRVTLVKGRVIEKGTGKPVIDATITFESSGRNAPENSITGWQAQQKTDRDGKFTYAVSAGHGTLVVRKKNSHYVLQTMESRKMTSAKSGGTRFYANAFHTMNVEKGTDTIEAEIEVLPGKTVHGVIVDGDGKSIEEAHVITRLKSWDLAGGWRGDSRPVIGGKFELTGLEPGESYKVHFLDARQKLGTTIELTATDEEVKVVLQPCGSATAKFVVEDADNREKMIAMQRPSLYFTLMPGEAKFDFEAMRIGKLAADEEFNANIDQVNYGVFDGTGPVLDDDFRIIYPALIPGATYRLQTTFDQSWRYREFIAKSGETMDLGEFTPKFDD